MSQNAESLGLNSHSGSSVNHGLKMGQFGTFWNKVDLKLTIVFGKTSAHFQTGQRDIMSRAMSIATHDTHTHTLNRRDECDLPAATLRKRVVFVSKC